MKQATNTMASTAGVPPAAKDQGTDPDGCDEEVGAAGAAGASFRSPEGAPV